jgi:hypothetical protein
VRATRQAVDGYWLNIPRPGRHCPTCNPPRPDLGIALLREIATHPDRHGPAAGTLA